MAEIAFPAAIFIAVLIVAITLLNAVLSRFEIQQHLASAKQRRSHRQVLSEHDLDAVLSAEDEVMRYYFEVLRRDHPDSLRARLVRAGFFSRKAPVYFNIVRAVTAFAVFVVVWWGINQFLVASRPAAALSFAAIASGVSFIVVNIILDKIGREKETVYRKLFPDLLDLLIVCLDSGLSIDAALDRVTREFLVTNSDFGTHLGVILLEIRAGRPLNAALMNFATQVNLDEARSLAILFRQAQELGSSVSKTLRVFAKDMRQLRIVRAEEKANSLPIKMLFPLAAFMFPVNLIIVLVPIMISILNSFKSLGPAPF